MFVMDDDNYVSSPVRVHNHGVNTVDTQAVIWTGIGIVNVM